MEKDERIEKLERENRALKSRCYALSSGSLCCFCPLECVHRSCDFLKLKSRCYALSSGSLCCFCPLECVHRSCDFLKWKSEDK